jgi:hypothetical protein
VTAATSPTHVYEIRQRRDQARRPFETIPLPKCRMRYLDSLKALGWKRPRGTGIGVLVNDMACTKSFKSALRTKSA